LKVIDKSFQHDAICIMREGHKLGSYEVVFGKDLDIIIDGFVAIQDLTLGLICKNCGKNYGYAVGCRSKRTSSHGGSVVDTVISHTGFSRYGIMLNKFIGCLIEHPDNDDDL